MRSCVTKFALVLLGVLALASVARAQEDATEQARASFETGRGEYEAGQFDNALRHFERAYELSHRPALLFNMASALERLRRDDEALEHYERYLAEVPEAENRRFIEARIRFLRSSSRERRSERSEAAATAVGGSIAEEWWFWTIIGVVVVGAAVGTGVGVALSDSGTEGPLVGNFGTSGVAMALTRF